MIVNILKACDIEFSMTAQHISMVSPFSCPIYCAIEQRQVSVGFTNRTQTQNFNFRTPHLDKGI